MEGGSKAWGRRVVGEGVRVNIAGWGGAGDQFGVHEIVHVLAVLAVLPGEALLNGPRGGEVRDTALPTSEE